MLGALPDREAPYNGSSGVGDARHRAVWDCIPDRCVGDAETAAAGPFPELLPAHCVAM
jgi:hypothetical protein